jgi:NADPH:quinone reductase-like Zn-dependent oxidoreductase
MKAIVISKSGPPEVLKLAEVPEPELRAGEVVVRVKAAGVNFADLFARQGLYADAPQPPFTPGLEVSGTLEKVGSEVQGLKEGQRVMAVVRSGGYAEKTPVPAQAVVPMPESMDFQQAAALPINYLTAYHMLFYMGNIRPGERVLIHAAAGGVGVAALQLCQIAGAEIYATASAVKFDFLRAQGVEHCIDYRTQDFEKEVRRLTDGEGVDIVLDAVGGESFQKSYNLLRPAGRLMVFGFSAAMTGRERSYLKAAPRYLRIRNFDPLQMMRENRAVMGVHIGRLKPEILAQEYEALLGHFGEGRIRPYVDRTFPLEQAAAAHRYLHERKNIGKVLLVP